MPVSPQDFSTWARMTGNEYPSSARERARRAPEVDNFIRNMTKQGGLGGKREEDSEEKGSDLGSNLAKAALLAGTVAAGVAAARNPRIQSGYQTVSSKVNDFLAKKFPAQPADQDIVSQTQVNKEDISTGTDSPREQQTKTAPIETINTAPAPESTQSPEVEQYVAEKRKQQTVTGSDSEQFKIARDQWQDLTNTLGKDHPQTKAAFNRLKIQGELDAQRNAYENKNILENQPGQRQGEGTYQTNVNPQTGEIEVDVASRSNDFINNFENTAARDRDFDLAYANARQQGLDDVQAVNAARKVLGQSTPYEPGPITDHRKSLENLQLSSPLRRRVEGQKTTFNTEQLSELSNLIESYEMGVYANQSPNDGGVSAWQRENPNHKLSHTPAEYTKLSNLLGNAAEGGRERTLNTKSAQALDNLLTSLQKTDPVAYKDYGALHSDVGRVLGRKPTYPNRQDIAIEDKRQYEIATQGHTTIKQPSIFREDSLFGYDTDKGVYEKTPSTSQETRFAQVPSKLGFEEWAKGGNNLANVEASGEPGVNPVLAKQIADLEQRRTSQRKAGEILNIKPADKDQPSSTLRVIGGKEIEVPIEGPSGIVYQQPEVLQDPWNSGFNSPTTPDNRAVKVRSIIGDPTLKSQHDTEMLADNIKDNIARLEQLGKSIKDTSIALGRTEVSSDADMKTWIGAKRNELTQDFISQGHSQERAILLADRELGYQLRARDKDNKYKYTGPEMTKRRQALELGVTNDPKFLEEGGVERQVVRLAGEEFPKEEVMKVVTDEDIIKSWYQRKQEALDKQQKWSDNTVGALETQLEAIEAKRRVTIEAKAEELLIDLEAAKARGDQRSIDAIESSLDWHRKRWQDPKTYRIDDQDHIDQKRLEKRIRGAKTHDLVRQDEIRSQEPPTTLKDWSGAGYRARPKMKLNPKTMRYEPAIDPEGNVLESELVRGDRDAVETEDYNPKTGSHKSLGTSSGTEVGIMDYEEPKEVKPSKTNPRPKNVSSLSSKDQKQVDTFVQDKKQQAATDADTLRTQRRERQQRVFEHIKKKHGLGNIELN